MITSKSNAKIKEIRKLRSSAKARRQRGVFIVEGLRIVKEVPAELLEEIYVSERFADKVRSEEGLLNAEVVADDVFRFLADTVTPQGILAVVRRPAFTEEISSYIGRNVRILLIDDVQDPGNLGTIVRTAEAAGVDLVILSEGCADLFNPKVIRSTMGSVFRVPILTRDLVSAIGELKAAGVAVYGAALEAAVDFRTVSFPEKMALVIGNEGNGISVDVLNLTDHRIKIPMEGKVESLNAAVSAAVLLYHMNVKSLK